MSLVRTFTLHDNEISVYADGHIEKIHKRWNRMHTIKQTASDRGYCYIALRNNANTPTDILVHRIIYLAHNPDWDLTYSQTNCIDHVDRNTSNNNINNLRVVTHQQNQFNRNAKGYHWNKCNKKWIAQLVINDKKIHLGSFKTEAEASTAYQSAKLIHHVI